MAKNPEHKVDTPWRNSWADVEERRRAGDPAVPPLVKPLPAGLILCTIYPGSNGEPDRRVYLE